MGNAPEPRITGEILVRIWGMDADGKPFFQNVKAAELTHEGAVLLKVPHPLKTGEVIGVQYSDKKARVEIKWVKPAAQPNTVEAGVRPLANQAVPWAEVVAQNEVALKTPPSPAAKASEKRKFARQRVNFPITISFADGSRPPLRCTATDMGGRGCYVETLVPLEIGKDVTVVFWIEGEKISTRGVVRASDPGVGMGIEFSVLEPEVQQRLQQHLIKLNQSFSSAAGQSN